MHDNLDELCHIEGFPLGEDEDLLALSDPPHNTAYPNSHIAEFIFNRTSRAARLAGTRPKSCRGTYLT
jgi:hypothetical protein